MIAGPPALNRNALSKEFCRHIGWYKADGGLKDMMARVVMLANLAKVDVLILDDWGLMKLNAENRRDLLEVLEDRHGNRSTVATSQLPIEEWHAVIGDPTLADAILDRLIHNAYKINLRGESMRKRQAKLTGATGSE